MKTEYSSSVSPEPIVTVLMSVYNGKRFVAKAIDSIANQTYENFEFIIIDDGSTDNTPEILKKYTENDNRIRIIKQKNQGLTRSLNRGASLAQGMFIARQDADDISMPERLERQVRYLMDNPDTVVVGSCAGPISGEDTVFNLVKDGIREGAVRVDISMQNFLPHSSAMFRKDIFEKCRGYNESFKVSQDFELWNRMSGFGNVDVLNEILVKRRTDSSGISRKKILKQMDAAARIRWKYRKYNEFYTIILIVFYGLRHVVAALSSIKIVGMGYKIWKDSSSV
jgi:glycosyltransferase involved in cell wall biosynthesis